MPRRGDYFDARGKFVADENGQMIFDLALVRVSLIVGGMTKSEETRLANLRAKKSDKKYELTSMDTLFLKKLESKKKRESRVQKSD